MLVLQPVGPHPLPIDTLKYMYVFHTRSNALKVPLGVSSPGEQLRPSLIPDHGLGCKNSRAHPQAKLCCSKHRSTTACHADRAGTKGQIAQTDGYSNESCKVEDTVDGFDDQGNLWVCSLRGKSWREYEVQDGKERKY